MMVGWSRSGMLLFNGGLPCAIDSVPVEISCPRASPHRWFSSGVTAGVTLAYHDWAASRCPGNLAYFLCLVTPHPATLHLPC